MSPRSKLFLASVVACAAALVIVCFAEYRRGLRAVDEALRADTTARARRFARAVESQRDVHLEELHNLAYAPELADFWLGKPPARLASGELMTADDAGITASAGIPSAMLRAVDRFFMRAGSDFAAVTFVARQGGGVVRFEPRRPGSTYPVVKSGESAPPSSDLHKLTDSMVEVQTGQGVVRRVCAASGSCTYSTSVVWPLGGLMGEVLADLRTDSLAARAVSQFDGARPAPGDAGDGRAGVAAAQSQFQPIALDDKGQIVYHPNDALKFQSAERVLPYFNGVAAEMAAGREGARDYADADGARWIAAYAPVRDLDLSVAVAANETTATAALRREGMIYIALSALLALLVASLVFVRERRASRRIESIARAARAVADGDLDRRLEVSESDRARPIADSFNLMTERLREHIRREAEGRQFQAFMRLSATLTHDLKNAITGLSMLVANMERQWEREEFRADAVASLRESVEKLNRIVARLNKPVETLSGEYRVALKPVDLSRVVRRVVEATAGQSPFHEVEMSLPEGLEVIADVERLERVFENLVINALEAMGASEGRLTVEGGREGEQSVFISVADTGAGMTPEFIRTKLFRPFATTKKQGLGLGLYTCREVVEAHGGRIDVESRPSSGTRFRVVLPSRPDSLPRDSKT